jgi:hypothetical protein
MATAIGRAAASNYLRLRPCTCDDDDDDDGDD